MDWLRFLRAWLGPEPFFGRVTFASEIALFPASHLGSAVHDGTSSFKPHVNLLPPSLSRGGNRQFLRRKCTGQVKLSFGYASAIMLFDGELRRESTVPQFV
ncbi:MAG: hypothetical protein WBQ43_06750 [Terriglobales bacterium]